MNISKLPDDVIKNIETFVDKRPPFADELLNREFRQYIWMGSAIPIYNFMTKDYKCIRIVMEIRRFDFDWTTIAIAENRFHDL
jgi:hypothetical protein